MGPAPSSVCGVSTPDVELRLPAQSPFVAVIRMTTAGLAARADFTLDDIEDLRMAVGEACALLLDGAAPGADMTVSFDLRESQIHLRVGVAGPTEASIDQDSFAWQVLSALVDDLTQASGPEGSAISFTATSTKG